MSHATSAESRKALENSTGVVVPVYFPAECDTAAARALLHDTAASLANELGDPRRICLSVDGDGPGVAIACEVAESCGAATIHSDTSRGKLAAVQNGMRQLLTDEDLTYFAIVDQDGDHFANELLNFIRTAQYVEAQADTATVMVLGRRISRHRPMGYARGELEELADRMLLDALQYHAAMAGKPLPLQFALALDEFPDFHSGFKLFTHPLVETVFRADPDLLGLKEEACYRHAVEAVITVEAILAGAVLASVNRTTLNEQPISTFALLERRQMVADKIIWPCKRLNIPANFVEQWLANHLPRLQMGTLVPEGREELTAIRALILKAFGLPSAHDAATIQGPPFI